MKTQTIFRMLSLSLLFVLLGSVAMGQSKQEKEIKKAQEAEKKAKQEQIEFQRQQMKEQQLKTIELERMYTEQAREASRARSSARVYSTGTGFPDEPSYFIYKGGQEKLMGFFVGQVMKASQGKANPGQVNQILRDKLKN